MNEQLMILDNVEKIVDVITEQHERIGKQLDNLREWITSKRDWIEKHNTERDEDDDIFSEFNHSSEQKPQPTINWKDWPSVKKCVLGTIDDDLLANTKMKDDSKKAMMLGRAMYAIAMRTSKGYNVNLTNCDSISRECQKSINKELVDFIDYIKQNNKSWMTDYISKCVEQNRVKFTHHYYGE